MNLDDRAFTIAARIADGSAIDWPDADASPGGPDDRALLDELKDIAALATLHRTPCDWPSDAAPPADSRWGPLTLIGPIGEGRFGRVYRAWDARLQRQVALKLLHVRSAAAASPMGAIEEARLLARVRHPNVLTVHGAECLDGQVGIWTEFIEGRTLEALLAERGPVPPEEVVAIGVDVCQALGAVHDSGLLHRDVKAQNVMRETGGRIVLMDFGTGHDLDVVPASGDLSGTPLCLAPEIFAGGRATVSSDVYALAVLLFRLLTGQYPVPGRTLDDVRAGHAAGRAMRLGDVRPELPEALVEAIERGLAQDPSQRFESAGTFETALRGAAVPTAVERPQREGHQRRLGTWMTASAAVLIALASFAAWQWWHPRNAIALTARDWVLVADFENRTGEPLFDGTVQYGVQRELANSSRVRVLPRPRIDDILRLMRKPLDSPIDPVLASEIAKRDGEVGAIVTGRIEHAGAGYLLTASVVSPQTAEVLSSVSERASSQAATSNALDRLAADLRSRLGEAKAAIDKSNKRPEPVTTPSLKALQTYSRAVELGDRGEWPAALELARQAVDEDPEFASARIWLAWALQNTSHKPEGQDEARAAVARINGVTEWERYWILGSYHYSLGDTAKAAAEFEALLALKPDHLWALNNLSQITGSNKYAVRLAELRPNDINPRLMIIGNLLKTGSDPADIEPYRQRALTLLSAETAEKQPGPAAQLLMLPAHLNWLKDDPRSATHDIEQALGDWRMRTNRAQQAMMVPAFGLYAAMGEIDAGRRLIAGTRSDLFRHTYSALAGFYSGRIAEARDEISSVTTDMFGTIGNNWTLPVWLMIHTGRLAQADTALHFVERHEALGDPDAFMAARGDLALARGNVDRAIALLEPAVLHLPTILYQPDSLGTFYRSSAVLAEARLRKGDARKAIETLQSALKVRGSNTTRNPGVFLVALRSRLAALYRHVGRPSEADVLDARVAKALELADPAFRRRLKQLAEEGISAIPD